MMKVLMPIGIATMASMLALTPAAASPATSPGVALEQFAGSGITQAKSRKKIKRKQIRRKSYNRGFRAGARYRSAPRGWRRYSARPYGWRTRGCIIVGPLWFCP
jgi:hypothetical protein